MAEYYTTDAELTATADAIRAKSGDSSSIEWESGTGFADAIAAIPSGGGGGSVYVVGSTIQNMTITPVRATSGTTITVKYTGSSMPLEPGAQLVVLDTSENIVAVLLGGGTMTKNAQYTFTMPSDSVTVSFYGGL